MKKNTIKDFRGVIPAVLSVFDQNEAIDEAGMRAHIRQLMQYEIGGLYLTGSTGEAFLMDAEERKRIVEIVLDEVDGRLPVVVHVGAISTKITIELAKHAEKCGAAGISSVPPFYFRFSNDQIYQYYKDIADAVDLPLIIYNIALAGMMPAELIKRLSEIENVAGIKYTGPSIFEIGQIKDVCKEGFLVFGGCDEQGASTFSAGVDGIIGSFYTVIPDLYIRIQKAVEASDILLARELQSKALKVVLAGVGSGSMQACLKLWLRASGVNAGYARRPFTNFTEEEQRALVKNLLDLDETYEMGLDIAEKIRRS